MLENPNVQFRPPTKDSSRRVSAAQDLAEIDAIEFPQDSFPIDLDSFCGLVKRVRKEGRGLLCMMDINQTLGVFERNSFEFYQDSAGNNVGRLLMQAALRGPVVLITGDQKSVMDEKFIPALMNALNSLDSASQKEALRNLTIYTNTGTKSISWNQEGERVDSDIEWAKLTTEEVETVKAKVIAPVIESYHRDPRFKVLIENGFLDPSASLEISLNSPNKPFYTQVDPNDPSSIEFSIFGLHAGERKFFLKRVLSDNPQLSEFIDTLIDECNRLLGESGITRVHAQLGGTTTIDFRTTTKGSVGFADLIKKGFYADSGKEDTEPFRDFVIVGMGDSFGPRGNDRSLNEVCNATLDVSVGGANVRNTINALIALCSD